MAQSQHRSKRKVSGGRYKPSRGKRKYELARYPANTKLAEDKRKTKRVLGGNTKQVIIAAKCINVASDGKTKKTEILNVVENPADPNLVRRNIMTKGAIVETKLGKVRVTSRPGQVGTLNGVLV